MASFDEVIPPGKAGTIRTSMHTGSLRGAVAKGITVTHDDPTQGPVALSLRANVVGSVEVLPMPLVSLAPGAKGGSNSTRLVVRKEASEKGDLKVTQLTASAPWLKVSQRVVTTAEQAGDGLPATLPGDVVLTIDALGAPVGGSMESVSFSTGLPREAAVSVPVRVTVRGPILVQPRDLILNPDPSDPKKAIGQAIAAVREDLDATKLVVATDSPAFTLKLEPSGARGYRLTVGWSRVTGKEPTEGTITLSVGKEETKLPVRVNVGLLGTSANGKP